MRSVIVVGLIFFLGLETSGVGTGSLSESESEIFCKNLLFLGGEDGLDGDLEDLNTLVGEDVTTGPFWEGPEDGLWSDFTTGPCWEGPEDGWWEEEGIFSSENTGPYLSGIASFNLSCTVTGIANTGECGF